jgi:hypothetical protein
MKTQSLNLNLKRLPFVIHRTFHLPPAAMTVNEIAHQITVAQIIELSKVMTANDMALHGSPFSVQTKNQIISDIHAVMDELSEFKQAQLDELNNLEPHNENNNVRFIPMNFGHEEQPDGTITPVDPADVGIEIDNDIHSDFNKESFKSRIFNSTQFPRNESEIPEGCDPILGVDGKIYGWKPK